MANYCFNNVNIFGDLETLKNLKTKVDKYEDTNYFNEWGDLLLDKKFDIENKERDNYEYGTTWWDFETNLEDVSFGYGVLEIHGDSAWSPPEKLIYEICKKYKLNADISYEEPGCDFMGESKYNWEHDKLIVEENCMSYREGMYALRNYEDWKDNLWEELDDGLHSYIHHDDIEYFVDCLDNVINDYVSLEHRKDIIDEILEITDEGFNNIIGHDYRNNENTLTNIPLIKNVILKEVNNRLWVYNASKELEDAQNENE